MKRYFFLLSGFIFIIITVRAIVIPFCYDEALTFFKFIQPGDFLPYLSGIDTNNHFLNSLLAWLSYHLFGDSPLALRLPNILALVVLIIAVNRIANELTTIPAKIILYSGFLLSFNFLGFFNLCRGYGISISLFTLALSYLPDYFRDVKTTRLLILLILLDLAVSANLMLTVVVLFITLYIGIYRLTSAQSILQSPLRVWGKVMVFIHLIILLFWINYSFYIKHLLEPNNPILPGFGSNYWRTTFITLIGGIIGKQNILINTTVILIYSALTVTSVCILYKNTKPKDSKKMTSLFFFVTLFNGTILGFYILNKFFAINLPEERTGLFIYALFILNGAFIMDELNSSVSKPVAMVTVIFFITHFLWNINFSKHCLPMYNIIPERFYDRLLLEQKNRSEKITIGAITYRELPFSFENYRHNGVLNPIDVEDNMLMSSDYYISSIWERKYYLPYYEELDSEKNRGFALLKRKIPLAKKLIFQKSNAVFDITGDNEFSNIFEIQDTVFDSHNPLMVDIKFKVMEGDMPSYFLYVVSIDTAERKNIYYKRIPFNWVKKNWVDTLKNNELILQTGILPQRIHRFVCYFWNLKKQRIKIRLKSVMVLQLDGKGVDYGTPFIQKPEYD